MDNALLKSLPDPSCPVFEREPVPAYTWFMCHVASTNKKQAFSLYEKVVAIVLYHQYVVSTGGYVSSYQNQEFYWVVQKTAPEYGIVHGAHGNVGVDFESVRKFQSISLAKVDAENVKAVNKLFGQLERAVARRFRLPSLGKSSDAVSKMLIDGSYWLASGLPGNTAGDWELLSWLMDTQSKTLYGLSRYPLWSYVAWKLLNDNTPMSTRGVKIMNDLFVFESVMSGALKQQCFQWRRNVATEPAYWFDELLFVRVRRSEGGYKLFTKFVQYGSNEVFRWSVSSSWGKHLQYHMSAGRVLMEEAEKFTLLFNGFRRFWEGESAVNPDFKEWVTEIESCDPATARQDVLRLGIPVMFDMLAAYAANESEYTPSSEVLLAFAAHEGDEICDTCSRYNFIRAALDARSPYRNGSRVHVRKERFMEKPAGPGSIRLPYYEYGSLVCRGKDR